MSKVYLYSQKIFNNLAILALIIGVTSCASSTYTAATSGETDGVYYSPSKDGHIGTNVEQTTEDYEIQVGGVYFDAKGNGAEDYYYSAAPTTENQNINIYTGSNNVYLGSTNSNWGRYDGIDITVNNWGWNDPFWGWGYGFGYNSWRFGFSSAFYWGGPNWYFGYNPYWGWGGYNPYFYNPYFYNPHYFYNPYYGGFYGWNSFRRNHVSPGIRPGSNLALNNNYRGNLRGGLNQNNPGIRTVRTGNQTTNVRSENIRPVRTTNPVRTNSNATQSAQPVRNNVSNQPSNQVRPVRASVPDRVKANPPVRTQQSGNYTPTRTQQNAPVRVNSQNTPTRNSNSTMQSTPRRSPVNSGSIRSSGSSSRGTSGGMGGGTNRGGSRR